MCFFAGAGLGRADTLLHEMAHMWFGDLVTMHWWQGESAEEGRVYVVSTPHSPSRRGLPVAELWRVWVLHVFVCVCDTA